MLAGNNIIKKLAVLCILICFCFVVVFYGKSLISNTSAAFRNEESLAAVIDQKGTDFEDVYERMVLEYQTSAISLYEAYQYNGDELGFLWHYVVSPLHLLPSKLIAGGEKPFRIV